jgi:uncharacterized membrane protein
MRRSTRKSLKVATLAAGLGAVAGLRSLTAPAALALGVRRGWTRPLRGAAKVLRARRVAKAASAGALGEMVVDASPFAPDRRIAPSLAWRMASGALVGAAVANSERKHLAIGIVAGGLGAVAGTFGGSLLRRKLSDRLPSKVAAVAEDAIAVGGGVLLARVG